MNPPSGALYYVGRLFNRLVEAHGRTEQSLDDFMKAELMRNRAHILPARLQPILTGSLNSRLTAFIQLTAIAQNINAGPIDGFWGPQTQYAFETLVHFENYGELPVLWRDWTPPSQVVNQWPEENEAALTSFYGQPCNESSLVLVHLPYTLRLAWDLTTNVNRIRCHQKVADSLLRVLQAVKASYDDERIRSLRLDRYGGCYNPRRKRGGSAWSTHAWGIALDFDPDRNQLQWGRNKAAFASPEYDLWWSCWEKEGWISLGRKANYDWMHVQAAI